MIHVYACWCGEVKLKYLSTYTSSIYIPQPTCTADASHGSMELKGKMSMSSVM